MTETMLKRVAKAIKAADPHHPDWGITEDEAAVYARAALEAIREPDRAMIGAGMAAEAPGAGTMRDILDYDNRGEESLAASFTAMVGAAVNERP